MRRMPLPARRAPLAARFGLLLARGTTAFRLLRLLARDRERLREIPAMALEILGAVAARAVGRVPRLLDDRGARFDRPRVVRFDVVDIDVEIRRPVADRPRAFEVGSGAAEHQKRL